MSTGGARSNLLGYRQRFDRAIRRAATAVGQEAVSDLRTLTSAPGTGRVYLRGVTRTRVVRTTSGRLNAFGRQAQAAGLLGAGAIRNRRIATAYRHHRASAPGDAPTVDKGKYRQSFAYVVKRDTAGVAVRIGTNAVQARALEFGNPATNLAPRPHFRRLLRINGARYRNIYLFELQQELSR